jgi:formylmethanofuran dehydrogenase subunit E
MMREKVAQEAAKEEELKQKIEHQRTTKDEERKKKEEQKELERIFREQNPFKRERVAAPISTPEKSAKFQSASL